MFDRLKNVFEKHEQSDSYLLQAAGQGKPKTFAIAQSSMPNYFGGQAEKRREKMQKWQRMYRRGGVLTSAINAIPELMFQNITEDDWKLKGKNEDGIDFVETEMLNAFDFLSTGWQQVVNSLTTGAGISENVRTKSDRFHSLQVRDPAYFEIKYTQKGEIEKYIQRIDRFKTPNELEPGDVWHLNLNPVVDSAWGLSMIEWSEDEILRDARTASGIAKSIERHGFPKWDITLNTKDNPIYDEDIEDAAWTFKNINEKNEFVHSDKITIEEKDTEGISNVADYSQTSLDRLSAATGVPEELLGLGRGSTEATANVRVKMFEKKIRSYQKRFNLSLWHQVLKPELEENDIDTTYPIYIDFGPVITDEIIEKAEALNNLMPQVDPFIVLTQDEIRREINYPEYPEDDDSPELTPQASR